MKRIWRRRDEPGLEVFQLDSDADGFSALSTIVHAGEDAFGMSYMWRLYPDMRTRDLDLRLTSPTRREMRIERIASGWRVDGQERPDLAGCDEVDLSATPFCNTLAMLLLKGSGELTTLYVDLPSMRMEPSRQRYATLGQNRWRYLDLGAANGFEADIEVDDRGLVVDYQGLFETVR
ncbi:putative glycolipid-binding domain-containing protein [Mesorhizobium sp. 1B3]|uniref:putative glycolipid-binding domain-containing protein n=1 Tax=Mesorhizobium sp. 1B3 TaxID=3243599 RepID=UPI003D956AF7